jgi:hypothetical protein
MSGFERAPNSDAWTDAEETTFPDDFTADEAAFASELRGFFAPERDGLPPLYAQTLLPNERYAAAECGFEYKVIYRVFRRLSLPRSRLFAASPLRLTVLAIRESLGLISRPLLTGMSAAMVFMALTVALVSPSFAAGLRILLGHTGVQQVASYPGDVQELPPRDMGRGFPGSTLQQMSLYWLGSSADKYTYVGMRATAQTFASGPEVELSYMLPGKPNGTGKLDIREFRISENYAAVLRVVGIGSAVPVKVGTLDGVYVDGQWVQHGSGARARTVWQPGPESELIFEYSDMIFWIVADQRDGMSQDQLIAIAQGLTMTKLSVLEQSTSSHQLAKGGQGSPWISVNDELLECVPADASAESSPGALVQFKESPDK